MKRDSQICAVSLTTLERLGYRFNCLGELRVVKDCRKEVFLRPLRISDAYHATEFAISPENASEITQTTQRDPLQSPYIYMAHSFL